jgi:hypothetical protein
VRIDPDIDRRRSAADGRAYVYVLPLHVEELLKVGFSRDPLARMRSLHPRYFDFFDCRRAVLVETDRVREARAIETALKRRLRDHRAVAPLEIAPCAGGDSEWYRGASAVIAQEVLVLEARGYRVHQAGSGWLRERLREHSAELFEWSAQTLEQIRLARTEEELRVRSTLSLQLRDALDALRAFDIDVAKAVPVHVEDWYRAAANAADS